ncbi:MAG: hypothetical protein IJT41_12565 [Clostridia bacterium]|nr:hypothetical protein [Clostridia bacterium]
MTVEQLAQCDGMCALACPAPEREICGVYIGDLLSWVMGRAEADNVWITIMSNVNIIAVAALADTACIILAEGVTLEPSVLETAMAKEINVLQSAKPIYETALLLHELC